MTEQKNNIINNVTDNETVHLYKREFYGLDKKCGEKFNLIDNFNELYNIQTTDRFIQIAEGIIIVIGSLFFLFVEFIFCNDDNIRECSQKIYCGVFIIYVIAVSFCFSNHVIVYINMLPNDYSNYNCSDSITNEIIKKGNINNKKVIMYNMICTFIDGIIIVGNLIALIIGFIWDRIDKCRKKKECKENNKTNCEEYETPYYDVSTYNVNN